MSQTEALSELVALELAHARVRERAKDTATGDNDRQADLERLIAAKGHRLGLAAATMLTAKLEYRYRSADGEAFTPSPEQALRIEAALWADNSFADRYARASLLASGARVTVITALDGAYQACVVELEQAGHRLDRGVTAVLLMRSGICARRKREHKGTRPPINHRHPQTLEHGTEPGSLAHNRGRYASRLAEPAPTGPLGPPSKHFDKAHAALWRELAAAARKGVLTNADRWMAELACTLMHQQRGGIATAAALAQLTTLLGKIGMTPADRSKVQVAIAPETDPDDPWASFPVQ